MSNKDFERSVQQELEELSFSPSGKVWEGVEASLPEKRKRRWLLLLFPFLIATGVVIFNYADKNIAEKGLNRTSKINAGTANLASPSQVTKSIAVLDSATNIPEVTLHNTVVHNVRPDDDLLKQRNIFVKADNSENNQQGKQIAPLKPANKVSDSEPARIKTSISSPELHSDVINEKKINDDDKDLIVIMVPDTSSINNSNTSIVTQSAIAKEEITDTTIFTSVKQEDIKQPDSKWIIGFMAGAGLSDLYSPQSRSSSIVDLNSGGPTSVPGGEALTQYNTDPAFAFTAGLFATRPLTNKLSFTTGISYTYLSNKLQVGARVDSFANVYTPSGYIATGSYYRNGNGESYINRLHFIGVPILMQLQLGERKRFFAEAGFNTSYLLNTNTLQFNSGRSIYYTDISAFNRLLIDVQAGFGVKLKALDIGFKFSRSINSLSKNDNMKQFSGSGMLYFRLPVKKL